jgi:protein-disulfide isomerase
MAFRGELFKGYRLGSSQGHANLIEFYWDYTCPYSAKSFLFVFNKLKPLLEETPAFQNQFALQFRHQVQPWHPQTVALHEAAMAVHQLDSSKFWDFSKIIFENIESYVFISLGGTWGSRLSISF